MLAARDVGHTDPAFAQRLSDLRACLEALAEAVGLRFAVPCRAVVAALWRMCPVWEGMDPSHLARCLASASAAGSQATLGSMVTAAGELSKALR